MKKTSSRRRPLLRLLGTLTFVAALAVSTFNISPALAQSGCNGNAPPVDTSHPLFRAGGYIYCQFDPSITAEQRRQIMNGLNEWNNRNDTNGSGVYFSDQDTTSEAGPDGAIYFTNGTLNPGIASHEDYTANPDGSISTMTITFNTQALANPSDPNSGPYYDPNLPTPPGASSNGYDTVFQKNAEHGVGHGMGLNDVPQPQTAGNSVMNNAVANCANDVCGNEPVDITNCDNSVVQQVPNYAAPTPTGGGGDPTYNSYYYGGDGWGGCTDYYWVYYVSYDGGETWYETGEVDYAGCW